MEKVPKGRKISGRRWSAKHETPAKSRFHINPERGDRMFCRHLRGYFPRHY